MTTSPSTPDTSQKEEPQDFLVFFLGIDKGRAAHESGEKLKALVAAITNTGKAGTLTIKLTAKRNGNSDAINVGYEVSSKLPTLPRAESIFFPDADNKLVREPPNQTTLFSH